MRTANAIAAAALTALLATCPLRALGADWVFAPALTDPNYAAEVALSVKAGMMDPHVVHTESDAAWGIELSLDSPWLTPGADRIRDQLSWNRFDHDGLQIDSFEWNPHYMVETAPFVWVGGGPGLGFVHADSQAGSDADMWAVQLGASLHTRFGKTYFGIETRYQWTQDDMVGLGTAGTDNWLTAIKFGYRF